MGKVVYVEQDYWPHNTSLWVTDFLDNSPRYVYHLYNYIDLSKFSSESGVPTLNRNDVHDHMVSIPKPKEQLQIASFLNKLDNTIEFQQEE
ncbi:restriction endonuclease subunit S [Lacrimispora sp.]|uniref:restriction endonuclease subunit S n=1 Tax=Lacrimispora sp. TaxID=2719234 RepID=UPI003FA5316E